MRSASTPLALAFLLAACAVDGPGSEPGASEDAVITQGDGPGAPAAAAEESSDADDARVGPMAAAAAAPGTISSVRIMSYNIKYGEIVNLDLAKLAAVIKESNPDILGLQEVDEETNRSNKKHETDELAALTGMQHRYFGANFDFDGGKYGLAILSKYPLSNVRVVRLDDRTKRENGFEPRIGVVADVALPGESVRFLNVHASLHSEEHGLNATRMLDALGDRKERSIVVGDFNETPGKTIGDRLASAAMVDSYNEKHRFFGFTSPASFPIKRIDFIYRGKTMGKTLHGWVPNSKASDHRPVATVVPLH